jgi:hypothetical protein
MSSRVSMVVFVTTAILSGCRPCTRPGLPEGASPVEDVKRACAIEHAEGSEPVQGIRLVEDMTPSDLESLSQEELESVCDNYIMHARAAMSARMLTLPPFHPFNPNSWINPVASDPNRTDQLIAQLMDVIESARVSCGRCFDVGVKGHLVRESYDETLKRITAIRAQNEPALERQRASRRAVEERQRALRRAVEEHQSTVEQLRQAGALSYESSQVRLEIRDIHIAPTLTEFAVRLTVLDEARILWPCNCTLWGYDAENPFHGGSDPIGASLVDNLGNKLPLVSFTPEYYGRLYRTSSGLHGGDMKDFHVVFGEYPANRATSVRLDFAAGAFGQNDSISFHIPLVPFPVT